MEESETMYPMPRIGDPAPEFEAETTFGPVDLNEYRGRWLVFFSHPMDFTPVCTTEFIEFTRNFELFAQLDASLLGLSVDGIFSHIAWTRNIEEKFGIRVPFPIVADAEARIARRYGMIMPGDVSTATSRCLFVIDPQGIIRATIYYPFTTGRSIKEVLRLVQALQVCDHNGVGTPADWQPGDAVIAFPPRTIEGAAEKTAKDPQCKEWYFCTKQL